MTKLKSFLVEWLPPILLRRLSGIRHGWHGNFPDWSHALAASSGYHQDLIAQKVQTAVIEVLSGRAAFERDSVCFDRHEYNFPLLAHLLEYSHASSRLHVVDFGGSLGSTFLQNQAHLKVLREVVWKVIEQKTFVDRGRALFPDGRIHFFETIEEAVPGEPAEAILLASSVLQYLPDPRGQIEAFKKIGFSRILLDRTYFLDGPRRLTVQKVPPSIYKASYPCWFFNEQEFTSWFEPEYELISTWASPGLINIKSTISGHAFRRKNA